MKKLLSILIIILVLVGCSSTANEKEIVVGASIVPHSEILNEVKSVLEEQGYTLKVVEFTDYVQPNLALDSKELDANYFQHVPYLEQFNEEHNLTLVSVAKIHYEPFGIYKGAKSDLSELSDGDKISVPNDTTNEARALNLLQKEGLITLKEGAGLNATKLDIVENPKNLEIVELDAAQLAKSIKDVAFSVINGNFALQEGLSADDVLAFEAKDSIGADTFANVIVTREDNQNDPKIKALVEALQSEQIKQFISDKYQGAVEVSF